MFDWFKKKSEVKQNIEKYGFDDASNVYAELVSRKIKNARVFEQFILEELDAASQGNNVAKEWVTSTGAPESRYKGALNRSFPEVDGPNGPQQELLRIVMQLNDDKDLMVRFRCPVVENIMRNMQISDQKSPNEATQIRDYDDIKALIDLEGQTKARQMMRDAAMDGNLICQIFFSQMGLQVPEEKLSETMKKDIETFTRMAAEQGDGDSQRNLGLLLVKKVDAKKSFWSEEDIRNLKEAQSWHEKAAAQGVAESLQSLDRIRVALGGR